MKIDAFGKLCPMPLVLAKKELDAGCQELDIAVDNETAVQNLARLAKTQGFVMTTELIEGGFLVSFSRKAAAQGEQSETPVEGVTSPVPSNPAPSPSTRSNPVPSNPAPSNPTPSNLAETFTGDSNVIPSYNKSGYVCFIGKDHVGEGDAELGYNLMKMALYTLSESDDIPHALLFMNSGVKLVCGDEEQIVDNLNTLIKRGTEVLVCGACLDFYGLKENLRVGTVSNMYDILGRMQEAAKVISF